MPQGNTTISSQKAKIEESIDIMVDFVLDLSATIEDSKHLEDAELPLNLLDKSLSCLDKFTKLGYVIGGVSVNNIQEVEEKKEFDVIDETKGDD